MRFSRLLLIPTIAITLCLSGCPSSGKAVLTGITAAPLFAGTDSVAATPATPAGAAQVPASADPSTEVPEVSEKSAAYAESIGGTDHKGEKLRFLIGASLSTEAAAQKALDRAIPLFGDMQSYFIVQRSDSFEGMRAGWWIVAEAYRNVPSQENMDFARRAFPDAYVKQGTVKVSSPIPVYEDLVKGQ